MRGERWDSQRWELWELLRRWERGNPPPPPPALGPPCGSPPAWSTNGLGAVGWERWGGDCWDTPGWDPRGDALLGWGPRGQGPPPPRVRPLGWEERIEKKGICRCEGEGSLGLGCGGTGLGVRGMQCGGGLTTPSPLQADNVQAQELWRGFILTMMEVPTDLELLPGHIFQLSEALRQERENRRGARSVGTTAVPPCFFDVSRAEAERLLERNAGGGNVVLRPGGHGQGFSISTRQVASPGSVALLKHYRVVSVADGFLVDVDAPVSAVGLTHRHPLCPYGTGPAPPALADDKSSEVTQQPCKPPSCPPAPRHPPTAQPRRLRAPPPLPKATPSPRHAVREGECGWGKLRQRGEERGRESTAPTLLSHAGAGSPPRSAPRPTPRRVPPLPHGHSAGEGGSGQGFVWGWGAVGSP
uniref:SH2 domain-containing protein n=1 Tax=Phasianus colchicus TaxID=9054 RepID=A0A669QJM9_PHACC